MRFLVILTFTMTLICVLDMVLGEPAVRHKRRPRRGPCWRFKGLKARRRCRMMHQQQLANNNGQIGYFDNNGQPIQGGGGVNGNLPVPVAVADGGGDAGSAPAKANAAPPGPGGGEGKGVPAKAKDAPATAGDDAAKADAE